MTVSISEQNIFTSNAQTLVNTVNCEGVMGAGIALEFRLRYPAMHERYQQLCEEKLMQPGKLWLFKAGERNVLNFPTKTSWKHPSRLEYITQGLDNLANTVHQRGISSIALPLLGADKGGLDPAVITRLIQTKLAAVAEFIPVTLHLYRPDQKDDLFDKFVQHLHLHTAAELAQQTGITSKRVEAIYNAVDSDQFCQLNQLAQVPGIGVKTLERLFRHCMDDAPSMQTLSLF